MIENKKKSIRYEVTTQFLREAKKKKIEFKKQKMCLSHLAITKILSTRKGLVLEEMEI